MFCLMEGVLPANALFFVLPWAVCQGNVEELGVSPGGPTLRGCRPGLCPGEHPPSGDTWCSPVQDILGKGQAFSERTAAALIFSEDKCRIVMLGRSLLPQRCFCRADLRSHRLCSGLHDDGLNTHGNLIQLCDIMPDLSTDVRARLAARAESSKAFP